MSRRQSWTVVALIAGWLVSAQPVIVRQEDAQAADAFKNSVGHYFTLLAAKDPSLTTFFEKNRFRRLPLSARRDALR